VIFDRLGVVTDELSQNVVEALDWVAKQGLKHVEIRMVDGRNVMDLSDQELDQLLSEVEKRGLFVSAVASPVFKCALDSSRTVATGDTFGQQEENLESHFNKLNRIIEIAARLKTQKIRIFSFWREEDPSLYEDEIVRNLKKAASIAQQKDMLLLLENEGSCNGGYASEVSRIVQKVDSPNLKALWDPGNEAHGGRVAYPDGYEAVKGLIGHVHLKDALIKADGEPKCVPIGLGEVSFADQLQALQKDHYIGLYTIETHYIPEGGTAMDGTNMTLEGLRKVLHVIAK
jgi:L-ribulose-5-phosphate 3-epimerase